MWAAAKKAERSLKEGRPVVLPLMSHYPASRNWRDVTLEATETLASGSPTEGYARCLAPATDVRQLKLFLKTRQWFVVQEQLAAVRRRLQRPRLQSQRTAHGWRQGEHETM